MCIRDRKMGDAASLDRAQYSNVRGGRKMVNGLPWGDKEGETDFHPVGHVLSIGGSADRAHGLNPLLYFQVFQNSQICTWASEVIKEEDGTPTTVYYPKTTAGKDLLLPGASPTFAD